ncbi:alanine/glycine:cation symporter family protein [Elusimicrobiota bacterium]
MLCIVYLELGLLFVYLTRSIAWKKAIPVFLEVFQKDASKSGERTISHRKAFLSSVALTVGIGNIAGVGTAIHLGGPGALFWMWVSALFGMFFRMASVYMAIKHRPADTASPSFATPMVYLEKYMTGIWSFIPKLVAGLILIQGVVLYNLVQVNSLAHALRDGFNIPNIVIAVLTTLCIGAVIMGGLKRIVDYCSAMAPVVIVIYVITGLIVLLLHPASAIRALAQVFSCAFVSSSVVGGVAGYGVLQAMQFGVSRGVFSHMSGTGTGTFFQAANKESPAVGAFMSAVAPFVDTIIICSITGLAILCTPYWQHYTGAHLTAISFAAGAGFIGRMVIIVSLVIFAFTTITAFAHISERCFKYLGGKNFSGYRIVFLVVTFIGPFLNIRFVWSLSDIIIATILIFHLMPLLVIILLNREEMCEDLRSLKCGVKNLF